MPENHRVQKEGKARNSLLAQMDDGTNEGSKGTKYLYISHDIVEVTLDEPVEGYYSEVMAGFASNPHLKVVADAPLAYAVTNKYVYLLHTMTALRISEPARRRSAT